MGIFGGDETGKITFSQLSRNVKVGVVGGWIYLVFLILGIIFLVLGLVLGMFTVGSVMTGFQNFAE